MDLNIVGIVLTILAILVPAGFSVLGYFYNRNYQEQREFRKAMYRITRELKNELHEVKVDLARNCEITKSINERTKNN